MRFWCTYYLDDHILQSFCMICDSPTKNTKNFKLGLVPKKFEGKCKGKKIKGKKL